MQIFKSTIRILLVVITLQIFGLASVFAQEPQETQPEAAQATQETQQDESKKVPVELSQNQKNQQFLLQLKNQLQNARNEYFQVTKNVDQAKERLLEVGDTIATLKDQLNMFNYLLSNAEAKIRNVEKQVAQRQNGAEVLKEEVKIKQIEIENQKLLMKDYLKLLYFQENSFLNGGDANLSASKLLLGDASIGDTFKEIEYFTVLEQTGENIFNKLDTLKDEYKTKRTELQQTRQKLVKLNQQLEEEKINIKVQKNAKDVLLQRTKGEESIYRELIAQSKREQLYIVDEINQLKENLLFIQEKIEQDGENFNPDNYKDLINPNVRAVYDFEMLGEFATGEKLNWPVKPSRGISAYFRDSSYYGTFGIPHNAIDIPTPQKTPIRAPAAGVVYKIKDNDDSSYSYIILAHKGGLLTVYGHMYETMVNERDIVLPGEVIGLSGGIPGTTGAGYLTTGAHLHFEVIKNGKHVDPLYLLDLDQMPEEYVPEHLKDLDLLIENTE